uniref:HD domain-containing protein n=1 Tax=Magnetococcus massalia (strain MO-1) TaxID=451514 RepID=A0A1S7LJK1_MAGMO|nr:Conserved protein of unknown function. Containing metal dependent phosphohydrolase (HD) domain [Candidatus Magnetococcus massalia]
MAAFSTHNTLSPRDLADAPTFKVFRDPVHDMIELQLDPEDPREVPPWVWGDRLLLEIIDTPELQRLRRIRQLGPASRVYPAAEHTRFSHALGAMHMAKQMVAHICRHHQRIIPPLLALQIKVAALIHDIGHGPYSHVFEHLGPKRLHHEHRSLAILREDSAIHRAIIAFCRHHGLDSEGFITTLAAMMGEGQPEGMVALGRQIIASQLDADRMDYLQRDAHFTGVGYGRFDAAWLLRSLRLGLQDGDPILCVDISKGPAALESYISARDDMYRQVYDHKSIRSYEALLIHLSHTMHALIEQGQGLPNGTPTELLRYFAVPDTEAFLQLDDTVLDYAIGHWSRIPLQDEQPPLLKELIWKSHQFQERISPYSRLRWHRDHEATLWQESNAADGTLQPGASDIIMEPEAAQAIALFFKEHGKQLLHISDGDSGTRWQVPLSLVVHVDTLQRAPYAHMQYAAGRAGSIPVMDGSGRILLAEEASEQINFLGHSRRRHARIFVDRRVFAQVRKLIGSQFHHPLLRLWEA